MEKRLIRSNQGATMVELVFVLLILLIVLFGISEAGVALYDKAVLTNASREGARAGIIAQDPRVTDGAIKGVVKNYATSHLITFGADILSDEDIAVTRTGSSFGSDLTVSVNYRYDFLVISRLINMLLANSLGTHITLNATTVMKLE
jgi:Flp pilus assembly protein TadG